MKSNLVTDLAHSQEPRRGHASLLTAHPWTMLAGLNFKSSHQRQELEATSRLRQQYRPYSTKSHCRDLMYCKLRSRAACKQSIRMEWFTLRPKLHELIQLHIFPRWLDQRHLCLYESGVRQLPSSTSHCRRLLLYSYSARGIVVETPHHYPGPRRSWNAAICRSPLWVWNSQRWRSA